MTGVPYYLKSPASVEEAGFLEFVFLVLNHWAIFLLPLRQKQNILNYCILHLYFEKADGDKVETCCN